MAVQCLLEACGYQVVFHLKLADASRKYVDSVIELSLPPELGGLIVKSVPTFIAIKDLPRLAAYFEDHIAGLRKNPQREAHTLLLLELGFQMQALSGEIGPDDDGEFTLRFQVNVGESPGDGSRVYVGAESVIDVEKVRAFIASLDQVMAEMVPSGSR